MEKIWKKLDSQLIVVLEDLNFLSQSHVNEVLYEILIVDARRLEKLGNNCVDMVTIHPPYRGIIGCSVEGGNPSAAKTLEEYLMLMDGVLVEAYRILKPGGYLCILAGDTRIHKH